MRYVSLINFMNVYAAAIKEYNMLKSLTANTHSQLNSETDDLTPIHIETNPSITFEMENCQLRRLHLHPLENIQQIYGRNTPTAVLMPPILEIEWLREMKSLSEEYLAVLEQLAYVYMIHSLAWQHDVRHIDETDWVSMLNRHECIIEVEDLRDTPKIVSTNRIAKVKLPKLRSWPVYLFHAASFVDLMNRCENQSSLIREIHIHMPILVSMFMLDYCHPKGHFTNWSKDDRVLCKTLLEQWIQRCSAEHNDYPDKYTYAVNAIRSRRDTDFLCDSLSFILERLKDANKNIGLITISTYCNVQGPETVHADVRLARMGIVWTDLIRAAEERKEEEAAKETVDGNEKGGL